MTQPEITNKDGHTYFVHHFHYATKNVEDDVQIYKSKYEEIVGICPNHIEFKSANHLYVRLLTDKKNIHNAAILNELKKI